MASCLWEVVKDEVHKLKFVGFIKEVNYTNYIGKIVAVLRPIGKVCINTIDLNYSNWKDSYPLPSIDKLVSQIVKHEMISLMDSCVGYNLIQPAKKDILNHWYTRDSLTTCLRKLKLTPGC